MEAVTSAIIPLIAIVAAGFLARKFHVVDTGLRKPLIDYCLYFGIPALVFLTITTGTLPARPPYEVWGAYLLPVALCWLAACIIAIIASGAARSSMASVAMAATYGNVLMLGIPVALLHFGPDASSTVAMVALVHSPVLFAAAAIQSAAAPANRTYLAVPGGSVMDQKARAIIARIGAIGRDLLTNPIIISIVLAMMVKAGDVTIPSLAARALSLLGQATLPCVLIAIGIGLASYRFRAGGTNIIAIVILKMVALPLLAWWIGSSVFRLEPITLAVVTFLSAMPVGANALAFAESNGEATDSISAAIAISTFACPISLAFVLWALAAQ